MKTLTKTFQNGNNNTDLKTSNTKNIKCKTTALSKHRGNYNAKTFITDELSMI